MQHHRRKFITQLAGLGSLAAAPVLGQAASQSAEVSDIRLSKNAEQTRIVFDLDLPVDHKLFTLHNPERVVLDLKSTRMKNIGLADDVKNNLIKGIRVGLRNLNDLRVVVDLSSKSNPRSFLLKPADGQGHRLVIDLHDASAAESENKDKQNKSTKPALRDVIVAIDPGHGGRDPGAVGSMGTREKDVTLQIARKLEKLINEQQGMKAALIRNSDRFMHLRDRIKKAHQLDADLMISLHADSFPDKRAKGASVYALSVSGASSESALLLAENENNSDMLFGNVNLDDKDKMVQQVLLDLSLTGTIQSSLDIGDEILKELSKVGGVHKKKVQQAGFAVLKAPNIPAILLESAFLSNPKEERKLRSSAHQLKLAKAVLRGANDYFSRKAPPGTWLSQNGKTYTVKSGDTLAMISQRFNTPVNHIRSRNSLHGDHLTVGDSIIIPVS